ncbi:MAG: cell wall hydrolase [Oscillospiraceae bacterium]|nr:cell wall hydrolase [Oscillospiraceae bacterium]
MRKAKVVAIVCGIIASCLIGGFAVVDAATITLDDSSTTEAVEEMTAAQEETTEAATETSLETTAQVRESIAVQTTVAETEPTEAETAATTEEAEAETVGVTEPAPTEEAAAENTDETEAAEDETAAAETLDLSNVTASDEVYIQNGNVITDPVSLDQPAVKESVVVEQVEDEEEEVIRDNSWTYSISESDYILLCNAVGHEAGANEVPVVEKAKVVEVIMNRVYSDVYPDDVYSVLTQKNQFTGASTYVDLGTFSPKVSDMVREAVDLYFADPSQFNHGYIGFWGDGHQNHFKTY